MHQGKLLEAYIKHKQISISKLAQDLGVSRTQVYNYFDTHELEEHTRANFEKVLGVNFAEMQALIPSANITEPKQTYTIKRSLLKQIESIVLVPLVPFKARAGYAQSYDQVDFVEELVKYQIPPGINPRGSEWRWFEIGGDSMEPVLHDGDMVLCSLVPHSDWNELKDFHIYAVVCDEEILAKRVARKGKSHFVLISEDDDHYEQQLVSKVDIKEIWRIRRLLVAKLPPTKKFKIRV